MDKLELTIVIVDYNTCQFTIELIKNLNKKLTDLRYEIIIVDNNPNSDNDQIIRKECKKLKNLKVIKAEKNLGFGAGNNLGAKEARGEYLLLLNPDTKIIDNSIQKMLDFLVKHPEIGALSPLLYQKDEKTLQRHFYSNFQNLASLIFKRWKNQKPINNGEEFFYTEMVSGAAMMIRKSLYRQLKGFDEKFFMYLEDDDLCRRINRTGFKNAVLKTAKIIHYEGQSSTSFEKKKFYYQSQDYYWQKHYGLTMTILMKILRAPYLWWQKLFN